MGRLAAVSAELDPIPKIPRSNPPTGLLDLLLCFDAVASGAAAASASTAAVAVAGAISVGRGLWGAGSVPNLANTNVTVDPAAPITFPTTSCVFFGPATSLPAVHDDALHQALLLHPHRTSGIKQENENEGGNEEG